MSSAVTRPLVLIVASGENATCHVPPGTGSDSESVPPIPQIVLLPATAAGSGLIVMVNPLLQPVTFVYTMVTTPGATACTVPVSPVTVANEGAVLSHVPAEVPPVITL